MLGIVFAAVCCAQQPASPPATSLRRTTRTAIPDLSGRWGGQGGFFAFKDEQGTHIYLPSREAPKDQDPDGKLRRYYLQVDGDKQRAANRNKPPYKPELLAKVHQLDRDENKLESRGPVPSSRRASHGTSGANRAEQRLDCFSVLDRAWQFRTAHPHTTDALIAPTWMVPIMATPWRTGKEAR